MSDRPPDFASRLQAFLTLWRPLRTEETLPVAALSTDRLRGLVGRLSDSEKERRATPTPVNVWQISGMGRDERRAATALAWLLNPQQTHRLGTLPLHGFFDAVRASDLLPTRPDDLLRCSIRVEERPMESERDRIDLVIDHPDLLIFVEIKIDATEGPRQLERYVEAAKQAAHFQGRAAWAVVYLTRSAPASSSADILPLSWRSLASAIQARQNTDHKAGPSSVTQLLQFFANY